MKRISAAEANRQFSALLRESTQGEEFLILSRGRPVARLGPVLQSDPGRVMARRELVDRLRSQSKVLLQRNWSRDELYER